MSKQGSLWGKWDLHVHSPKTHLANGYNNCTIDDFVNKIVEQKLVAIGLTNYFCFHPDELSDIKSKLNEKGIVVFPNLEFRTQPKNKDNEEMHVHIIFSNILSQDKITGFLSRLSTINDKYCNSLSSSDIETTSISFDTIKTTLESDKEIQHLRDYLLIACPRGDGSFRPGEGYDSRGNTLAITIDRSTDILFGNNKDREFFMKKDRYDNALPKPVLLCSDAHSLEGIGKSYSWIKADVTFEGLKQILYEPLDRVNIEPTHPYDNYNKIHISEIEISGVNNFPIPNTSLKLNRELITIIGGRGSGKSVLLDCIAMMNEEHVKLDSNGKPKVIEYYRAGGDGPSSHFKISTKVIDKDNKSSQFSKEINDYTNFELPILYIGQEQLNGIATNDRELTNKICNLIGIEDNTESETALIQKGNSILASIDGLESEIERVIERYPDFDKKKDFLVWIDEKHAKKLEQFGRLTSESTKDLLQKLTGITDKGLKIKTILEKLSSIKPNLVKLSINETIESLNEDIELTFNQQDAVSKLKLIDTSGTITTLETIKKQSEIILVNLRQSYTKYRQELINKGIKEDVATLIKSAETLQNEISTIEKDKIYFSKTRTQLENGIQERNEILDNIVSYLNGRAEQLTKSFEDFKSSRDESKVEEQILFNNLIEGIDVKGEVIFDKDVFNSYMLTEIINKRKCPDRSALTELILGKETLESIELTWNDVINWIKANLETQKKQYFNNGGYRLFIHTILTQWETFVSVRARVELDGVPTYKLSIGQRGTLLLKIYLATANAKEICVIDQPEDNLDNKFIMGKLVPMLRNLKKYRQIIISTHNANLVINTDAEQVVVAMLDSDSKKYLTGPIENTSINKHIRDILEGGEEAFKKRYDKYYISG